MIVPMGGKTVGELLETVEEGLEAGFTGHLGSQALDELDHRVRRLEAVVEAARRVDEAWEAYARAPRPTTTAALSEARSAFSRALTALEGS